MNEMEVNDYRTSMIIKANQYRKNLVAAAPFKKEIEYWCIRWDGECLKVENQEEIIIHSDSVKTKLHSDITPLNRIPYFLLNIFNLNSI